MSIDTRQLELFVYLSIILYINVKISKYVTDIKLFCRYLWRGSRIKIFIYKSRMRCCSKPIVIDGNFLYQLFCRYLWRGQEKTNINKNEIKKGDNKQHISSYRISCRIPKKKLFSLLSGSFYLDFILRQEEILFVHIFV